MGSDRTSERQRAADPMPAVTMPADAGRSGCPINLSVEVLGDGWTLVVIRDVMFGNRRHFRELLTKSEEGIASNILTDRLRRLVDAGLLTRTQDPSHKQRQIYRLSEPAIQLVPVFATLGAWGSKFLPVSKELSVRAKLLADGGEATWSAFMQELRQIHLGAPDDGGESVMAQLNAAYEAEIAKA